MFTRFVYIALLSLTLVACGGGGGGGSNDPATPNPNPSPTPATPQITVSLGAAPAVQDGSRLITVQSNVAATIANTAGGCTTTATAITSGSNTITITGTEGDNNDCTIAFRVAGTTDLFTRDIPDFTVRIAPVVTESAVTIPTKSASIVASISVTFSSNEAGTISFPNTSSCSSAATGMAITAGANVTLTLTGASGAAFAEGTVTDCIIRVTSTSDNDFTDYVVGGNTGFTIDVLPTLTVSAIANALGSTTPTVSVTTNLAGTLTYSGCHSTVTSVTSGTTNNVNIRANSSSEGFDYGTSHSCVVTFAATNDTDEPVSVTRVFTIPSALTVASPGSVNTGNPRVNVLALVAGRLTYAGNCTAATTTVTASFSSAIALSPSSGTGYAHDTTVANCVITLTDGNSASQSVAVDSFTINIPFVPPTLSPTVVPAANNLYAVSLLLDRSSAMVGTGITISYSGACRSSATSLTASLSSLAVTTTASANFAASNTPYSCTVTFTSPDGRTVDRAVSFTVSSLTLTGVVAAIAKDQTMVSVALTSSEAGSVTVVNGSSCAFLQGTAVTVTANTARTVAVAAASGTYTEGTYTDCILRVTNAGGSTADYRVGGSSGFTIDLTPTLTVTAIPDSSLTNSLPSVRATANIAGTLTYTGDCQATVTTLVAGVATTLNLRSNANGDGFDYNDSYDCDIAFTGTNDATETVTVTRDFVVPSALSVSGVLGTNTAQPSVVANIGVTGRLTYAGNCSSSTLSVTASASVRTVIRLADSAGDPYDHDDTVANCVITLTDGSNASQSVAVSSYTINIPFVAPTVAATVTPAANNLYSVALTVNQNAANYPTGTTISYTGACTSTTTALRDSVATIALTTTTNANFAARTSAYPCTVTFTSPDSRTIARSVPFTVSALTLTGVVATVAKDDTTVSVALTSSETGVLSIPSSSSCAFASGTTTAITANTAKTVVFMGASGNFPEGTITDCTVRVTNAGTSTVDYTVGGASGFVIDYTPTLTVSAIPASALSNSAPSVQATTNLAGTLSYSGDCQSTVTAIVASTATTVPLRSNAASHGFDYGESYDCDISFTATNDATETVTVSRDFAVPGALTISAASDVNTANPSVAARIGVAGTLTYAGNCTSSTSTVTASSSLRTITLSPSTGTGYLHGATVANCVITLTGANSASQTVAVSSFTLNIPFIAPTVAPTVTAGSNNLYAVSLTVDQSTADYPAGTTIAYTGDCRSVTTALTSSVSTIALTTTASANFAASNTAYACTVTFTSVDGRTVARSVPFTVAALIFTGTTANVPKGSTTVTGTLSSTRAGTLSIANGSSCTFGATTSTTITAGAIHPITIVGSPNTFTQGTYTNCVVVITASDGATAEYQVGGASGFFIDLLPRLTVATVPTSFDPARSPTVTVTSSMPGALTYTGSCTGDRSTLTTSATVVTLTLANGNSFPHNSGPYSDCRLTLTAADGDTSAVTLTAFSIAAQAINLRVTNARASTFAATGTAIGMSADLAVNIASADCDLAVTTVSASGTTMVGLQNLVSGGTATAFTEGWHSCSITATEVGGTVTDSLSYTFFVNDAPTVTLSALSEPTEHARSDAIFNAVSFNTGQVRSVSITLSEDASLAYSSTCSGPRSAPSGTSVIEINVGTASNANCTVTVTDANGATASAVLTVGTVNTDAPSITLTGNLPEFLVAGTNPLTTNFADLRQRILAWATTAGYTPSSTDGFDSSCNTFPAITNPFDLLETESTGNRIEVYGAYNTLLVNELGEAGQFAVGSHTCDFWLYTDADATTGERLASNVLRVTFTTQANAIAVTIAGNRHEVTGQCSANRMASVIAVFAGTAECTRFQTAEALLPHAIRTPGYAQFHYETEQIMGAMTHENSRLSVVDTFRNDCRWTDSDWATCWDAATGEARHGDRIEAVIEGLHGVPIYQRCDRSSDSLVSTIIVTVINCIEDNQIVNISLSPLVGNFTNRLNLSLANSKNLFFTLSTGNCTNNRCATSDGFDVFTYEPYQHSDSSERANPNPSGSMTALRTLLSGHRAMLVTGVLPWYPSETSVSSINIRAGEDLQYVQFAPVLPCGSEWRHCVAAPFAFPVGLLGSSGTTPRNISALTATTAVAGTSYSSPTVASALATLLHRWPRLWNGTNAPEKLANIVYNCSSYDYTFVASNDDEFGQTLGADPSTYLNDATESNAVAHLLQPVYAFSSGVLTVERLRRVVGRGVLQFDCLFSPNGTLMAAPDDFTDAPVVQADADIAFAEQQHTDLVESIEDSVDEHTTVAEYNEAIAEADAIRANALENIASESERYIPTTTGRLYLSGVDGIESLIGYDAYGRDFNRTPAVSSSYECQDFFGQLEKVSFALCDNTVRMSHRINGYVNLGWFLSNSSYNGSFGTDDLRFGDSLGVKVEFSKGYNLGKGVYVEIATEFNAGYMFSTDKHSYLREYQAYSVDFDLSMSYKGLNISVRHESGSHGSLHILNHELDLSPREDTQTTVSYSTKI